MTDPRCDRHDRRVTPDAETLDWIFEAARYWLGSFGGFDAFAARTTIVVPSEEDFPVDLELEGHELAEDYFAFVVEHAGLGEWPFELSLDEERDVASVLRGMPHAMTSAPRSDDPEGAPIEEGDPLLVPYLLSQLQDPVGLVASMARGVSHYHLYDAPAPPPGTPEDRELYVDVGAVFLGFGVFLASSAFRYRQHESGGMVGWGYSRAGALSELDISGVLALVATLLDVDTDDVDRHLATNPRAYFRATSKLLRARRGSELSAIRRIQALERGPYR